MNRTAASIVLLLHAGLGYGLMSLHSTFRVAPRDAPTVIRLIPAIVPPPPVIALATREPRAMPPAAPLANVAPPVIAPTARPTLVDGPVALHAPMTSEQVVGPPTPAPPPTSGPAGLASPSPSIDAAPASIVPPDAYASGLDNPSPRYPLEARRREQGVVLLTVDVTASGAVAAVSVSKSSGHALLDREALATVRRWRFRAASHAGISVAARGLVEIPFVLRELSR